MGNQHHTENIYQEYFKDYRRDSNGNMKEARTSGEGRLMPRAQQQAIEYFRHQSFNNLHIATQEVPLDEEEGLKKEDFDMMARFLEEGEAQGNETLNEDDINIIQQSFLTKEHYGEMEAHLREDYCKQNTAVSSNMTSSIPTSHQHYSNMFKNSQRVTSLSRKQSTASNNGLSESASQDNLAAKMALHPGCKKKVTIILEKGLDSLEICIEDGELTCGWLLKHTIKRYSQIIDKVKGICRKQNQKCNFKKHLIAALRSTSGNESLDYYLTLYDRKLENLPANLKLQIYFSKIGQYKTKKIGQLSFDLNKVIGRGGFSKVFLARKKDSGLLFAIKVMEKDFIRQDGKYKQVIGERKIMENLESPFIVKLHYAFQTEHDISFVMDLCAGGELFYLLQQNGRLSEDAAKFYFAEILLGLEYLHQRGIVYRDMKPENVLIDIDGHLKLADFGLSKFMNEGELATSFCGSPEYMSPEMLLSEGHSIPVDYYSLGAILFEMLTGLPPHYDQDRDVMYRQIVNNDLEFPEYLSREVVDLIARLIQKRPEDRYTFQDMDLIKEHVWCSDINWEQVETKTWRQPPVKPDIMKSNFDPEYTSIPVEQAQKELPNILNIRRQNEVSTYCNMDYSAASFYHANGESCYDLNNSQRGKMDSPNHSFHKNQDLDQSGIFDDFSFYSDPVEEKEVQRQIQKYYEMKAYFKKLNQQMIVQKREESRQAVSGSGIKESHSNGQLFQTSNLQVVSDYGSIKRQKGSNFNSAQQTPKQTVLSVSQNRDASNFANQQARKHNNRYGNSSGMMAPRPPQAKASKSKQQARKDDTETMEQMNALNQRIETEDLLDDGDFCAYGAAANKNDDVEGELNKVLEEDNSFYEEQASIAQEYSVNEGRHDEPKESSPCETAESRLAMRDSMEESTVSKAMLTYSSFQRNSGTIPTTHSRGASRKAKINNTTEGSLIRANNLNSKKFEGNGCRNPPMSLKTQSSLHAKHSGKNTTSANILPTSNMSSFGSGRKRQDSFMSNNSKVGYGIKNLNASVKGATRALAQGLKQSSGTKSPINGMTQSYNHLGTSLSHLDSSCHQPKFLDSVSQMANGRQRNTMLENGSCLLRTLTNKTSQTSQILSPGQRQDDISPWREKLAPESDRSCKSPQEYKLQQSYQIPKPLSRNNSGSETFTAVQAQNPIQGKNKDGRSFNTSHLDLSNNKPVPMQKTALASASSSILLAGGGKTRNTPTPTATALSTNLPQSQLQEPSSAQSKKSTTSCHRPPFQNLSKEHNNRNENLLQTKSGSKKVTPFLSSEKSEMFSRHTSDMRGENLSKKLQQKSSMSLATELLKTCGKPTESIDISNKSNLRKPPRNGSISNASSVFAMPKQSTSGAKPQITNFQRSKVYVPQSRVGASQKQVGLEKQHMTLVPKQTAGNHFSAENSYNNTPTSGCGDVSLFKSFNQEASFVSMTSYLPPGMNNQPHSLSAINQKAPCGLSSTMQSQTLKKHLNNPTSQMSIFQSHKPEAPASVKQNMNLTQKIHSNLGMNYSANNAIRKKNSDPRQLYPAKKSLFKSQVGSVGPPARNNPRSSTADVSVISARTVNSYKTVGATVSETRKHKIGKW